MDSLLNGYCSLVVLVVAFLLFCLFVAILDNGFVLMYLGLCLVFVFGFWLICLLVVGVKCGYDAAVWIWLVGGLVGCGDCLFCLFVCC